MPDETTWDRLLSDARCLNTLIDEGPRPMMPEMFHYLEALVYTQFKYLAAHIAGSGTQLNNAQVALAVGLLATASSDLIYVWEHTDRSE